jgi:putative transposase
VREGTPLPQPRPASVSARDMDLSAGGLLVRARGATRTDSPRREFRPAYHDARAEGWNVNHKKIQRLWRDDGVRVP